MSDYKIPNSIKSEFKKAFEEYIKGIGRDIFVVLDPYKVDCPNCIMDSVQKKSSNVYHVGFVRPVNIFPGTTYERLIYPAPFNVTSVSGVQYDPALPEPKILQTTMCPVCKGAGTLIQENRVLVKAVVDRNQTGGPGAKGPQVFDLSAGRDARDLIRLKTYNCNYKLFRDAVSFIVDGVIMKAESPTLIKGIGIDALVEVYVSTIKEDAGSSTKYDGDNRPDINQNGQMSNQAPIITPTIPPKVPGDDVW